MRFKTVLIVASVCIAIVAGLIYISVNSLFKGAEIKEGELLNAIKEAFENKYSRDAVNEALKEVENSYKGKNVEVTGKITSVDWWEERETYRVLLERKSCGKVASGSFSGREIWIDFIFTTKDDLRDNVGSLVSITGEIESIGQLKLWLLPKVVIDIEMRLVGLTKL